MAARSRSASCVLRGGELLASPLSASINLKLQDGDTNILASPRIRTRNKEKARILVGDKLPQITNLLSPQQNGQNSVVTGSIQYVDVGIKLEVEAGSTPTTTWASSSTSRSATSPTRCRPRAAGPTRSARGASDHAAAEGRRDAGAGWPDQRLRPPLGSEGAGPGPDADGPAVLQPHRRHQEDRDHPLDHAAHHPPAVAAGPAQRRRLVGQRDRRARRPAAPAALAALRAEHQAGSAAAAAAAAAAAGATAPAGTPAPAARPAIQRSMTAAPAPAANAR